jgi:hypothetical protein
MALTDTGMRAPTSNGENAKTSDGDGNTVIVETTHEAIKDHGWDAIFGAASEKYDAGEIEPDSNPPRVRVTTEDCSGA